MRFAHGVHLDAYLLGAGYRQEAQRLVVEYEAVRVVVDNDDVVASPEVDQLFKQFARGRSAGRHVRIVDPHEFHAREVAFVECVKVGLPPVLFAQFIRNDAGLGQSAYRGVGRVSRVGNQHAVAGIEKSQ